MSNRTLWGFGDSFTAGSGIMNLYPNMFPYENTYSDYIYLSLLGKELDCVVRNCAFGGNSNGGILHTIVANLKNIKKNDIVVIGASVESRLPLPLDGIYKVHLQYGLINRIEEYLTNKITKPTKELIFSVFSKKELSTIRDYYYTIFPKLSKTYYNTYHTMFKDLQDYFMANGITCIIWDSTCWDEAENIEKWSRDAEFGSVADGHWSPNGNLFFKEVLYNALQEGILFISSKDIQENNWKELFEKKNKYIPAKWELTTKKVANLI